MAGLQHDDAMPVAFAETEMDLHLRNVHRDHFEKELSFAQNEKGDITQEIVAAPPSFKTSDFISTTPEPYDPDHEGLEFPTDEEKVTLRRVSDSIPWNAYRASLPLPPFVLPNPVKFASSHRLCRVGRTVLCKPIWSRSCTLISDLTSSARTVLRIDCRLRTSPPLLNFS